MAYSYTAAVEASLECAGDLGLDPTRQVYERLFAVNPDMAALFWRDSDGAIRGEMLARVFDAILDFVGERRYADHMISTEMITHEGYDVPREVFITFFRIVGETLRELLAGDWTEAMEVGWRGMMADMHRFGDMTPRSDVWSTLRPSAAPPAAGSAF